LSDFTRRLIDSIARRDAGAAVERGPAAPHEFAEVLRFSLPGGLDAKVVTALMTSVETLLVGIAQQLDLPDHFKLDQQEPPAEPGLGTLSIGGRPAAVFRCPVDAHLDDVRTIANEVATRATGRLRLLARDGSTGATPVAAYLADLGVPRPDLAADAMLDMEWAEAHLDQARPCEIGLEVSAATLRRAPGDDARAMGELRRRELLTYGVQFPNVWLLPTDEPAGTVRLQMNAVSLPTHWLGDQAAWTDVVEYLGHELHLRRHWFVRLSDVRERISGDLVYYFPELVAITRDNFSDEALTGCLRELVTAGGPIRNLPRILWLLLEQGTPHAGKDSVRLAESPLLPKARSRPAAERDPVVLAARVRKLAIEEAWRLGNFVQPTPAVRLTDEAETAITQATSAAELGPAEWAVVRAAMQAPDAEVVVTRTIEGIAPVRSALQSLPRTPRVMASHELPPDADLSTMRVLPLLSNR
jgi:hypothetical protein